MLQRIAHGDLVLLGPTSGILGFFLGPLWFYAGLPGYILSGGNPYGIASGYMLLASLAIPLYWLISHRLFPTRRWAARGLALGLALISGSIHASIFIWNPLISLPLVAGATYSFMRAREHRAWLVLGFFLFALTLQSEFAYAIFFLAPLVIMIPWMRTEWNWKDFVFPALAGVLTLIPQVLAELKTKFAMTKALIAGMQDTERQITWLKLWTTRPAQLFDATREQLVNNIPGAAWWTGILLLCALVALIFIWRRGKHELQRYEWRLISVLALLPYIFFMFWRSNYGYFFEYYITPHFLFVLALVAGGLVLLSECRVRWRGMTFSGLPLALLFVAPLVLGSWHTIQTEITPPQNNGGLRAMTQAADQVLDWQQEDHITQATVLVYTPNIQTEHHDFVMQWRARARQQPVPITVKNPDIEIWYLLMEPPAKNKEVLLQRWYAEKTEGGIKTRSSKIGVMTLETWQATDSATLRQ